MKAAIIFFVILLCRFSATVKYLAVSRELYMTLGIYDHLIRCNVPKNLKTEIKHCELSLQRKYDWIIIIRSLLANEKLVFIDSLHAG